MAGLLGTLFQNIGAGGLLSQKDDGFGGATYPRANRSTGGLSDPETRLLMGAAMLSGKSFGDQLGGAMSVLGARRLEGRKRNKTLDWLQSNNPELAQAVASGALDLPQAAEMAWRERTAKPKTTEFQDRAAAAAQYGLDPNSPQGQAFILSGKYGGAADGAPERALNGIPMQDAQGRWFMGQLDSAGSLTPAKMPDGFTVASPYDKAAGTAQGKAEGGIRASLPTAKSTADSTTQLVDDLLKDPNLDSAVGPIQGRLPSFSAGAIQFDERVQQLQGKAFLEARQMLKGGGQITDYEGKRAESAMARLSQAKSEDDFKAALMEFKSAVSDGYAKLEAAYGGGPGVAGPLQGGGGFNLDPETDALVRKHGGGM